jgi:hypothetical protein
LYNLQFFNVDGAGGRVEIFSIIEPFPTIIAAVESAHRMRYRTHYSVNLGGHLILEDSFAGSGAQATA